MKQRVLLCVLDWGLGHAARCLSLLQELELCNHQVVVASSGKALAFLRIELPGRDIHELPGYDINYESKSFEWGIIRQSRKIQSAVSLEHELTREIVRKEKVDVIISDNRYGCYDESVPGIFLSHHINIRAHGAWRALEPAANAYHRNLISKFDHVWVPDYPDQSLSGELSSGLPQATFIGPLTTMRKLANVPHVKYDLIAVLSGPEPERTRLEEILFGQLKDSGKLFLLVGGNPDSRKVSPDHIGFLTRAELNVAIQSSSMLISRSGYSTIMDMTAVGGNATFIPTPGQTEQLYLAEQMEKRGIAFYQAQDNFDLALALAEATRYKGFDEFKDRDNGLLKTAISNLTNDGKLD